MEFKTKYNVGDIVCVIDVVDGQYRIIYDVSIIDEVVASVAKWTEEGANVSYYVDSSDDFFDEHFVFRNYYNAIDACNELNGLYE